MVIQSKFKSATNKHAPAGMNGLNGLNVPFLVDLDRRVEPEAATATVVKAPTLKKPLVTLATVENGTTGNNGPSALLNAAVQVSPLESDNAAEPTAMATVLNLLLVTTANAQPGQNGVNLANVIPSVVAALPVKQDLAKVSVSAKAVT